MAKRTIYITPKNATSHEILNLTDMLFAYITGENNTIKFSYGATTDTISFKNSEDCLECFKKIQESLGVTEV